MTAENRISLTIVLVSFNSAETINKAIASLYQFPPTCPFEVVVVDNASKDNTVALVTEAFPRVRIIRNDANLGFGVANNIGMVAVPGTYYYLHNIDAYLQAPVLDQAIAAMDREGLGILGLPLVYPDGSAQSAAYSFSGPAKWLLQDLKIDKAVVQAMRLPAVRAVLLPLLRGGRMSRGLAKLQEQAVSADVTVSPVDWVCGASLMLSDNVLSQTGGFDPKIFLYGEDEDLCRTAHALGFPVGQAIGVTPVIHEFGWGKSKKSSAVVVRLRRDSLLYCIDKWFAHAPISRLAMRLIANRRYGGM
jgi:GT2 family glycosyltransferase